MKKSKPIKLGKIKEGKLIGASDSVTWDMDITLAIFLRDSLKRFREISEGIPESIYHEFFITDENEAIEKWHEIIDEMISGFDFYLQDDTEFKEKSNQLYKGKSIEEIIEILNSDNKTSEEKEALKEAREKHFEFKKKQIAALKKSLTLVTNYIDCLWW